MLAGAVGTLFSGTISDKLGRSRTLLIIGLSTPVFMWLFLISSGIWTFPVLILLGFFLVAPTPVILAIVNGSKSQHPAFMNGIYMGLNFLLNALALLIMSLVADIVGLRTTFFITIFISLFAIPFIYLIDRSTKKE